MSAINLFTSRRLRLTVEDPKVMAEAFFRWNQDSEFMRLLDTGPAWQFSTKKMTEWMEKDAEGKNMVMFMIRRVQEGDLIGFMELDGFETPHREAFVGIGIGPRELWGQGYGTEAMQMILTYAFQELNLNRVSLSVFEYNQRAVRSYEKAGFVHEGRERGRLLRDGRRWDMLYMGILREEWEANQQKRESVTNELLE